MGMPLPLPHYTIQDLDAFPDDGQRYEILQGILFVTPQAGPPHQVVAARLIAAVYGYLDEKANIVGPGAVQLEPDTHLEPDVLVVPGEFPLSLPWSKFHAHWLAVEIYSPSSRIYDHDYKRDAYLALGVREVWLVDITERSILVSNATIKDQRVTHTLTCHPPEMQKPLELSLDRLFHNLG
jgi:Uma2 family endonuclease